MGRHPPPSPSSSRTSSPTRRRTASSQPRSALSQGWFAVVWMVSVAGVAVVIDRALGYADVAPALSVRLR